MHHTVNDVSVFLNAKLQNVTLMNIFRWNRFLLFFAICTVFTVSNIFENETSFQSHTSHVKCFTFKLRRCQSMPIQNVRIIDIDIDIVRFAKQNPVMFRKIWVLQPRYMSGVIAVGFHYIFILKRACSCIATQFIAIRY